MSVKVTTLCLCLFTDVELSRCLVYIKSGLVTDKPESKVSNAAAVASFAAAGDDTVVVGREGR